MVENGLDRSAKKGFPEGKQISSVRFRSVIFSFNMVL